MLDWFVMSYQSWNSNNSEESINVLSSLESVTNELDLNILRKIILSVGAKIPEEHSVNYFKDTLNRRVEDLGQSPVLAKLINLLRAINLALGSRKAADIDLSNVVYAVDAVSKVSKYIITSLTRAKTTIATILDQVKSNPEQAPEIIQNKAVIFDNIKRIFHLTRLLQEYARIVGPTVDEGKNWKCKLFIKYQINFYIFSYQSRGNLKDFNCFSITIYSIFTICSSLWESSK